MFLKVIRRIVYLFSIGLAALFLAVLLLISPIAEYVIEKYSVEWTGRRIEMDYLRINLLNGVVKVGNLRVFEAASNEVFVGLGSLYINSDLYSFISGSNIVPEITLENPVVTVKQDGEKFNFDDLIVRFQDSAASTDTVQSEPVRYLLKHLGIRNGTLNYICATPGINAGVVRLNLDCSDIAWDDPQIVIKTDFSVRSGGHTKAALDFNPESGAYNLSLDLKDFNIKLLYPYLNDYLFVKSLDGLFSTSLVVRGNTDRPADISAGGMMSIRNFSLVDTTSEQLASIGALQIDIDSINSGSNIYYFKNIIVDRPFVRFAMYDDGYNFDRIMVPEAAADTLTGDAPVEDYANIFRMMADYIAYFTREYKVSNYKADNLRLTNGEIYYTDYTLEDKFAYHLDSLQLISENLNSADDRLKVTLDARMNTSGVMSGTMQVNPDGFSEMEIGYSIRELLLSDVNPYSVYYVASPFVQGRLSFESKTTIRDHQLKSENILSINQIQVGEKVKNSTAMNLPVKLAVSLLKDLHGNIKLSIPVEGDLNDPTYKWGRALLQVLKNIVVKAAVAPYKLLAGMFGGDEDQYKEIRMKFLQTKLLPSESDKLENLVKALKSKPELAIGLVQLTDSQHETEALALFMAKQEFLGLKNADSLGQAEISRINSVENRDSLFNSWVDHRIGQSLGLQSVQQKVIRIYGNETLKSEVANFEQLRALEVVKFFSARGIDKSRITMQENVMQNVQTAQTGPVFKLSYLIKGEDSVMSEGSQPYDN
ncbi:MAG: hypothetical protein FD166_784 [Bacteroidetes bacterium]|nr:MAG: hypothetical protein FD166_784 [Bacteroidota bacterium]